MKILRYIALILGAQARALSLFPLIIFSLLVAVLLVRSGTTLAYPAFQSPLSPVGSPTATPAQMSPQPTVEAPTTSPTAAPSQLPTESPEGPPTEVPGEIATPTGEVQVSPTPAIPAPEASTSPADSEEPSPSVRRLSRATLIDTLIVGLSALWLCCGAIVLVLFVLGVVLAFVQRPE